MCCGLQRTRLKKLLALRLELLRKGSCQENLDCDVRSTALRGWSLGIFHPEKFGLFHRGEATRIDEFLCGFFAVHDIVGHDPWALLSPNWHIAILGELLRR